MRKMLHLMFNNFKKIFLDIKIYVSILIVFLLFCCTYFKNDECGKSLSISNILLNEGLTGVRDALSSTDIKHVINAGIFDNIVMFAPLVCILPLIGILVYEKQNNVNRFVICRSGKVPYILSNFFTSIFISIFILVVGTLIFYSFVFLLKGGNEISSNLYKEQESINLSIIWYYVCLLYFHIF